MAMTVKRKWLDIKHNIKALNPEIFEIFEKVGCDDIDVSEATYPYGFLIGDEKYLYLPDENGEIQEIDSENYPYMILAEKTLELYLETEARTVPNYLYSPGDFMPMTIGLTQNDMILKPSVPFKLISGARSISMMSLNKNSKTFYSMQRQYGFDNADAESPDSHFDVFKGISDSISPNWQSKLYIFPSDFSKKLKTDPKWQPLMVYLLRKSIRVESFNTNSIYLDYAITEILTAKKISMRPFSVELVKQILLIALGARIGFKPIVDSTCMPVDELTSAFVRSFKPTTSPIFIGPTCNNNLTEEITYLPIPYFQYSLNDPKKFRPVFYLREVFEYMLVILNELSNHKLTKECVYGRMKDDLELSFYTERAGEGSGILAIKEITLQDKRFAELAKQHNKGNRFGLCSLAPFSKALVGIKLLK